MQSAISLLTIQPYEGYTAMSKKRIALIILTVGLGLGVVRAVANQIVFELTSAPKAEVIQKNTEVSKAISLETATSILAFGLAGFCVANSRKKV